MLRPRPGRRDGLAYPAASAIWSSFSTVRQLRAVPTTPVRFSVSVLTSRESRCPFGAHMTISRSRSANASGANSAGSTPASRSRSSSSARNTTMR